MKFPHVISHFIGWICINFWKSNFSFNSLELVENFYSCVKLIGVEVTFGYKLIFMVKWVSSY